MTLFLSKVLVAFVSTQYEFQSAILSIKIAAAIKNAVYQKALKLSTSSRRKYTAGNISNLYTTDIERVVQVVVGGHSIWVLPLQIIAARYSPPSHHHHHHYHHHYHHYPHHHHHHHHHHY